METEDSTPEDEAQNLPGTSLATNGSAGIMHLMNKNLQTNKCIPLPPINISPLPSTNKLVPLPSANSPTPSDDSPDNSDVFFKLEEERLKTFEKWPLTFLSPEQLARNGFYYLGRGDEVRCAFCKVEIMRWEEGDDPAKDHLRWAPQCPFLRKQNNSSNGSVESTSNSGRDECGVHVPIASVRMPGPVHPLYASQTARLRSFKDWPRSMRQKPEDMADAGFFYTGQGDKTKCFYCDGGLKDWENDDKPWEQHARWFDRCAYVQLVKGREYVQKVLTEACLITSKDEAEASSQSSTQSTNSATSSANEDKESNIDDDNLCKICYVEERNVVFVPCGHVVACAKCALTSNKCPLCRRIVQNAVRIYFS